MRQGTKAGLFNHSNRSCKASYANAPISYLMFKLGEYHENEARSIVNSLKDAKIKVEQKTYLCAETETSEYIEGKLSDLRGEVKDIETYERYLSALKIALAKGPNLMILGTCSYQNSTRPGWTERISLPRYSRTRPDSLIKS
jgi:hypothetical protein